MKNIEINQLLKTAENELKLKNFLKAESIFKKIILSKPNIPEVYNNLGIVYLNLKKFNNAIDNFTKALKINSKLSMTFFNLGVVYNKIGNFRMSEKNYLNCIKLDNSNIWAHYNIGNLYRDNNNLNLAERRYEIVIKLKPDMVLAYQNLFYIYHRSNQYDKLRDTLESAKKHINNNLIVHFFQGIYDFEQKNFNSVIKNFEKLKVSKKNIGVFVNKNHFLAKSYEQKGYFKKAYDCFEESNNFISKTYENIYNKQNQINIIKKRLNFFSNFDKKNWILDYNHEIDPIFLIGFPRSGTTLLDTILRSHSSVDVIEEKPIVENFINKIKLETNDDLNNLSKLSEGINLQIFKSYIEEKKKFIKKNENLIFIDKLPLNLLFIGEIIRFFPNAKFVFSVRNPFDVILSCFMQQFSPNDSMMNFLTLKDASYFYDISMTLYKKYYQLFPDNIFEIKYENLIFNFEENIKKLLNFLNLNWENDLKEFYKTATKRGIISTPSYNQINKPLYKKSINNYKNYITYFSNIDEILNKWAKELNYEKI